MPYGLQVNRWLSVRLEMMGVGVVLITAVVVTVFPTNAGLAGLALTSALNLTGKTYHETIDVSLLLKQTGCPLSWIQIGGVNLH